ncbi:MAG: hypothetical protein ACRD5R_09600 [Candidatus Acidiferrales bacterium]
MAAAKEELTCGGFSAVKKAAQGGNGENVAAKDQPIGEREEVVSHSRLSTDFGTIFRSLQENCLSHCEIDP